MAMGCRATVGCTVAIIWTCNAVVGFALVLGLEIVLGLVIVFWLSFVGSSPAWQALMLPHAHTLPKLTSTFGLRAWLG